jgi:ADP-heptose:LPS heptosyltransferase
MPLAPLTTFFERTRSARKLIVVALGFLGDSIQLIPALWEIRRHYPRAQLEVLTTDLGREVLQLVPCVDRIWPVGRNPRQSNWGRDWQTVRALRRERFDVAINFCGADRPTIWTALTGARLRVAHRGAREHFWSSWLVPHWVPRQPPEMPIAEQHLKVLEACGLTLSAPRWDFALPEEAKRKAESLVPEGAIHFSICASSPLKEWPVENWIGLAKRLLSQNPQWRLLATASPHAREQGQLQTVARAVASERLITLSGLSIPALAAVLQRCRCHVGADSGVLHLAVAVGLPTVSLFRDYHDASSWTPAGPAHRVFRVPCVCVNQRTQPCAPAQRAECLGRLGVADIEAAVLEQLAKLRPDAAGDNKLA